jgi:hypothetical protein
MIRRYAERLKVKARKGKSDKARNFRKLSPTAGKGFRTRICNNFTPNRREMLATLGDYDDQPEEDKGDVFIPPSSDPTDGYANCRCELCVYYPER